ncbi:MAG: PHP-associated domain-containing protein [Acidobacteriota bacterium]
MKADLHVHSYHSGYAGHWTFLRVRDCYSSPEAVYRIAKARGMDLVCLTDHDSIDGCLEFLNRHPDAPDFIIGEEVECYLPDAPGLRVHLGVIGMTEAHHREVQRLRGNVGDVAAYLRAHDVFFAVNHLFMLFGDQMPVADYITLALSLAPALEVHNGAMLPAQNALIADVRDAISRRRARPLVAVGGSDAHTLQWVGTAYTETGGTTREDFLTELRAGHATTGGAHGGRARLMSEIYGVIFNSWRALAGLERHDLTAGRRLVAAACSLGLLPLQFVPAICAVALKGSEARRIARYRQDWAAERPAVPVDARPAAI